MNTELYDKWVKSYQLIESDVDLTDAVMTQIAEKAHGSSLFKETWQSVLQDMMQVNLLVRAGVLASGVLMGLIRMAFQVYTVLFT